MSTKQTNKVVNDRFTDYGFYTEEEEYNYGTGEFKHYVYTIKSIEPKDTVFHKRSKTKLTKDEVIELQAKSLKHYIEVQKPMWEKQSREGYTTNRVNNEFTPKLNLLQRTVKKLFKL